MKLITTPAAMREQAAAWRSQGLTIGLVPTMGWFHEGHLSLMRAARSQCDRLVVSLFVNPIQFGPSEDLDAYPRDLKRDQALAEAESVDCLYAPAAEAMYPAGFQTTVRAGELSRGLCGASRAGHFDGVCTVVLKLFGQTGAQLALFGEKDFQQLAVLRRMALDLDLGVEIIGHPIVREADGLAMSSRNVYLNDDERQLALCLVQAVELTQNRVAAGVLDVKELRGEVEQFLARLPGVSVDYVALVHDETLQSQDRVDLHSRLIMAVRINDRVRLIDNAPVRV